MSEFEVTAKSTIEQLKEECRLRGLKVGGKKDELIARLGLGEGNELKHKPAARKFTGNLLPFPPRVYPFVYASNKVSRVSKASKDSVENEDEDEDGSEEQDDSDEDDEDDEDAFVDYVVKDKYEETVVAQKGKVFQDHIKSPKPENRNEKRLKSFVVWKSFGAFYAQYHHKNPPPEKQFDSSYDTVADANNRVMYVFLNNKLDPWRCKGLERKKESTTEKSEKTGLVKMTKNESNEFLWSVGAVQQVVFEYLMEPMVKEEERMWSED